MTVTLPANLAARVAIAEGDCWLWTGSVTRTGYGVLGGNPRPLLAHRLVYEAVVGPIGDGLILHHLCHVTLCVRPDHLMPLTPGDHRRIHGDERTHCKQGHEFTPENTYVRRDTDYPQKQCRRCRANAESARRLSDPVKYDLARTERRRRQRLRVASAGED